MSQSSKDVFEQKNTGQPQGAVPAPTSMQPLSGFEATGGTWDPNAYINESTAALGGVPGVMEEEPKVMLGWTSERTSPSANEWRDAWPNKPHMPIERTPQFQPVSRAQNMVFTMPDEDLVGLQQKLFAAGFYPSSMNLQDVGWGTIDPVTHAAWGQFLNWAATAKGRSEEPRPWFEVLDELVGASGGLEAGLARGVPEPERIRVQLSDPVGLAQTLDKTAQAVLGRKTTREDQRLFVAQMHQMQREAQIHLESGSGVREGTMPDAAARAEQVLRERHPTEAGGMDVFRAYEGLKQQLFGRSA